MYCSLSTCALPAIKEGLMRHSSVSPIYDDIPRLTLYMYI